MEGGCRWRRLAGQRGRSPTEEARRGRRGVELQEASTPLSSLRTKKPEEEAAAAVPHLDPR
jgi:hypothetical protein